MVENACRNLRVTAKGHSCTDYANRPLICRKYSTETCDRVKGGYDFEEQFEMAQQLDDYAKRMLGEAAYETAKIKGRKKAERAGEGNAKKRKAPPILRA